MKTILMVPAVIGLLAVPSFALAHSGVGADTTARVGAGSDSSLDINRENKRVDATTHVVAQSRVDANDDAAVPAIPATPATPSTPATPATPAVPAGDHDNDDSGHHANVSVAANDNSVRVDSSINE